MRYAFNLVLLALYVANILLILGNDYVAKNILIHTYQ